MTTRRCRIILRTDVGEELGHFPTTHAARRHAETLDARYLAQVLVVCGDDGVTLGRRFPS